MNCHGIISLLPREPNMLYKEWCLKNWYVLLYNPHDLNSYYSTINYANIFINSDIYNMEYNINSVQSILDHININLV
jgi:hypothetical protein